MGGGVKARAGPLGLSTGSVTAALASVAAVRGASGSVASGGGARSFTGGATNGRTTFGGAIATTLGRGVSLGALDTGSGTQISEAARGLSREPATIVCGAFTWARGARASGCLSAGAISGSFSRKLYQTIRFSYGRISWS
jgi:hypothetical protein